jgi:hypothetical protein
VVTERENLVDKTKFGEGGEARCSSFFMESTFPSFTILRRFPGEHMVTTNFWSQKLQLGGGASFLPSEEKNFSKEEWDSS